MDFEIFKNEVQNCKFCEEKFGFIPHPVFWGNKNSKIVQISQAPSNTVHMQMKPFTDASGKTLKYDWYQISDDDFYNKDNFFIGALAHCYPGKDKNGNDKNPPSCCFDKWVKKEISLVNNKIYILIGSKAAKKFFPQQKFEDLVFSNQIFNGKLTIVLPHPSPLNKKWLKDHPDFLNKRIVQIRKIINDCINE